MKKLRTFARQIQIRQAWQHHATNSLAGCKFALREATSVKKFVLSILFFFFFALVVKAKVRVIEIVTEILISNGVAMHLAASQTSVMERNWMKQIVFDVILKEIRKLIQPGYPALKWIRLEGRFRGNFGREKRMERLALELRVMVRAGWIRVLNQKVQKIHHQRTMMMTM
jgi:hypothetical protein